MHIHRFMIWTPLALLLAMFAAGCTSFGYRPLCGPSEYRDRVEQARKLKAFRDQEEINQIYDRIYGDRNYLPPGEIGGELRLFGFGE